MVKSYITISCTFSITSIKNWYRQDYVKKQNITMSSESNEVNEENSRQWLTDLWLQVTNPEEERVYYDVTAYKYEEVTSNLIWRAPELCMKGILNYEQKSGTVNFITQVFISF